MSSTSILQALHFAANKHRAQRRKDSDSSPYINHPIAVAELLGRVGMVTDPVVLLAAILHDTIEDTDTSPAELEDNFGADVRRVVEELSDDKSQGKEERKRAQSNTRHAPMIAQRALPDAYIRAASGPTVRVLAEGLTVREAPDNSSDIVGQVMKGQALRVLERSHNGDWYRVETEGSPKTRGWVGAGFANPPID